MEKRFCRSIFLTNNGKQVVVLPFNTTPCQAWASKHCVRFSAHTLSKFTRFACTRFGATQSLRLGTPLRREHQASPMSCYDSRANCPINLQVIVNGFRLNYHCQKSIPKIFDRLLFHNQKGDKNSEEWIL